MYSEIRRFLRENREKPVINFFYRHLKILEKKRLLQMHPPAIVVDVEGTQELYQLHVEWLQLVNNYTLGKILDVGSKYGLVTKVKDVVALDISRDYLRVNVHENRVLADACSLPFVNEGFETVVATEILEHLEHPGRAVEEFERVLKHEGRVVMSVPNRYSSFSELTHLHYFTEKGVCRLFRHFDVVVCRALSTGHIFGVFNVMK